VAPFKISSLRLWRTSLTAALRVTPHLAWGVVAPQSQSAEGYTPSSRLAPGQMRRNACIDNSVSQHWCSRARKRSWATQDRPLLESSGGRVLALPAGRGGAGIKPEL